MICDLHCHTTYSDGVYSPSELVWMAANAGLGIIAVTDHDSVSGCKEAQETIVKERLSVSLVKGIELSAASQDGELHLLGLFVDDTNIALRERLAEFKADRERRIYKIIDKLAQLGYHISADDVFLQTAASEKAIGRPHVAAALVAKGYFTSVGEVFDGLLFTGGPAYVGHLKPSIEEAIALIHGAGGLALTAHPFKTRKWELVEQAIDLGADGLEVYYPEHTPEMMGRLKNFAAAKGLKISGGSDFHGIRGKYPSRLGLYSLSVQMLNLW